MIQPSEMVGPHDVLFNGKTEYVKVNIKHLVQNTEGKILWVEGNDGAIYNWSNILVIRKARG